MNSGACNTSQFSGREIRFYYTGVKPAVAGGRDIQQLGHGFFLVLALMSDVCGFWLQLPLSVGDRLLHAENRFV